MRSERVYVAWVLAGLTWAGVAAASPVSTNTPPELSMAFVQQLIAKPEVRSVEAFLEQFPRMALKRHLLAYHSESRQYASFWSPRVIVYSFDADFIMAYNGEPGTEGYNEIEILEFDHAAARFRPRLITFDPQGKAAPKYEAQPRTCVRCHQVDIRPNWDPYFHWPGFYGSDDDGNVSLAEKERYEAGVESVHYREFLAKQHGEVADGKGRYRFLPPHPSSRPNLDFNERVTCLNVKRFVRAFIEHPDAGKIVGSLGVHSALELDKLPPELLSRATRTYAEVEQETRDGMMAAIHRRLLRHVQQVGRPVGRARELETTDPKVLKSMADPLKFTASWRFVWEEILKRPFAPQSTSRHADYSLNLGGDLALGTVLTGARVDEGTGKVVLDRSAQERSRYPFADYSYTCPRNEHYYDMPLAPGRH